MDCWGPVDCSRDIINTADSFSDETTRSYDQSYSSSFVILSVNCIEAIASPLFSACWNPFMIPAAIILHLKLSQSPRHCTAVFCLIGSTFTLFSETMLQLFELPTIHLLKACGRGLSLVYSRNKYRILITTDTFRSQILRGHALFLEMRSSQEHLPD